MTQTIEESIRLACLKQLLHHGIPISTSDIVRLLINIWQQPANMAKQGFFFPLHLICGAGIVNSTDEEDKAVLEIVRVLIEASHESVLQTTEEEDEEEGYLPIHFAVSERSSDICTLLLNAYPESLKIGAGLGSLFSTIIISKFQ